MMKEDIILNITPIYKSIPTIIALVLINSHFIPDS